MSNKSSEPKQLELPQPKEDPILKLIQGTKKQINDIVTMVAVVFMQPLQEQGKTFSDAKSLALDSYRAFLNTPMSQNSEKWVAFFMDHVQTHNVKITGRGLVGLRERLLGIQRKKKIEELFEARNLIETWIEENKRGELKLDAHIKDLLLELKYDLYPRHF